jgi:AmmeMemoRadiSam system protein A
MSSAERAKTPQRSNAGKLLLLDVARQSIECGLRTGEPCVIDPNAYPAEIREQRASFVTLRRLGELRGCLGALEVRRPLVSDVAHSAFGAAFRDYRFPPVESSELEDLEIHISILSALELLSASDEDALLDRVRPGIDGLVVRAGTRQGTFLPSVWESLPEPAAFWRELKRKAGLPADAWSSRWEIFRYTVESLP